ncbi:probable E3 ubiquitin-protein ligase RHG1A [Lotus japonicus]|uniref:probable E3 ubiquitin-protein ligase RHG1A n=1 Tax=Lotus japonicus TaxID=34305 RepID=UPI00258F1ED9|nr:probable E3 ubiquitin-protein ligase RHG1A [Lotus japonicus]
MQGQRGTLGSLAETLEFEFEYGPTQGTAAADQHSFWNNILSPTDMNPSYINSVNHEWQNLSGWSLGEPSSSNTLNEVNTNEQKRELGLSSSMNAGAIGGPRLEQRRLEPTNAFSLDNVNSSPMYISNSNSHLVSQNLNLNAGLPDSGSGNSYHVEHPNLHKSSVPNVPVNEHIPPAIGSGSFLQPSGSNNMFVEDTDGRPGYSLDTRRVSCKRKAIERSVGQSSDGGSSGYTQHTDGSAWNILPTQDYAGSIFNRSAPAEQANARLGLSMGGGASESIPESNVAGSSESFHRNFRLRVNPSSQQIPVPPTTFSNGSVIRNSAVPSSLPVFQRFHPVDNSQDLRPVPPAVRPADAMIPQSQPLRIRDLQRNIESFRRSGGSSSTNNHSPNPVISANRDPRPNEEGSSRNMPRNILEHPVFVPPTNIRNVVRNPTRAPSSANVSIPGNVAPSSIPGNVAPSSIPGNVASSSIPGNIAPASIPGNIAPASVPGNVAPSSIPGNVAPSLRTGLNSTINSSAASAWVSRPNPQQYPRRLSEYVRRSLFSPGSEAAGSPSNNYSSLHGPPTSSESRGPSSGVNPGAASWLERSADSEFGIPQSLRSLAVAGEGGNRLVSELRNVLGLMRRGGNLRLEDVMILDQSMFAGIANIHDRHRDMRLDVDNMSYEELLALEERIGNVNTGLTEETIMKLLKQKKYSAEPGSQGDAEPCCVCQEEYNDGDDIGSLNCGHFYHTGCIKQWLMHKNLCPICKTTGLAK